MDLNNSENVEKQQMKILLTPKFKKPVGMTMNFESAQEPTPNQTPSKYLTTPKLDENVRKSIASSELLMQKLNENRKNLNLNFNEKIASLNASCSKVIFKEYLDREIVWIQTH